MSNDLSKRLKEMQRAAKKMNNQRVDLSDVLTDSFMAKYTDYKDADSFFEASGFDTSSQEAYEAIPDEEINKFTSEHSKFSTWSALLGEASKQYLAKQMGF